MQNLDMTQLSIEPIQDTWDMRGDTAAWYINFQFIFASLSVQEINTWYAKSFSKNLESFATFGRVWQVSFRSSTKSKAQETTLKWELKTEYDNYIQNVIENIIKFPDALEQLKIKFDLSVFVRTEQSPNKPIRAWVRNLIDLTICGGKEYEKYAEPVVYIDMNHTLFCSSSIYGEDNKELYCLNQPLLEKALRNWEQRFGTINEFDGLEGIYKYGFLPEDKW